MRKEEVEGQYELETGNVIVDEILNIRKINPDHTPAVLVKNHGPFSIYCRIMKRIVPRRQMYSVTIANV